MDCPNLLFENCGQRGPDVFEKSHLNLRHLQSDTFAGEVAKPASRPAVPDINQFLERVQLCDKWIHTCTIWGGRSWSPLSGLFTKVLRPFTQLFLSNRIIH